MAIIQKILPVLFTLSFIFGTLSNAQAADLTEILVSTCKNSAMTKYSHTYTRFKGISGRPSSRRVKLLVIPQHRSAFNVECFINAKTQKVLTIKEVD